MYPHTLGSGEPVLTYANRDETEEDYLDTFHDMGIKLFGVPGSYEHECGNHPILTEKQAAKVNMSTYKKSLNYKMDRYASFLGKHKNRFILFDVHHWIGTQYDPIGTDGLFNQYLEFFEKYAFADHILLARHRDVTGILNIRKVRSTGMTSVTPSVRSGSVPLMRARSTSPFKSGCRCLNGHLIACLIDPLYS